MVNCTSNRSSYSPDRSEQAPLASDSPDTICFTLANRDRDWPDLDALTEADIERQPLRFVGGRNSWIAQSYLRLRAALIDRGFRVRVSAKFEPGAICIAHRDDANGFTSGAHRAHLVVIRADRPPVHASDHVVVQNAGAATGGAQYLPLWPQPGIMPRASTRGERVSRLAYAGRTGASPSWFFSPSLHRALRQRGVVFDVRRKDWNDYHDVEVAIAARVEAPGMLGVKPATKLYNAWLAGVPMLAAAEPAYRELRRSPLDFLEVGDDEDVVRAIDRLRADPRLYRAMVANGRDRAKAFAVDAVRACWLAFVDHVVIPAFVSNRDALASRLVWYLASMTRQKLAAKAFRARDRWTLAQLAWAARIGHTTEAAVLTPASIGATGVSSIRSRAA